MDKTSTKRRIREERLCPEINEIYGTRGAARYCIEESVVIEPWNSEEGRKRLIKSQYNHAFFHLAHLYQPQKNPFFCGVASIVIALNALRLEQGLIPSQEEFHYDRYDPETNHMERIAYRIYSQVNLLDEDTDKIKKRAQIAPKISNSDDALEFDPGLSITQVQQILEIYHANVQMVQGDDDIETGIYEFRDHLMDDLKHDKTVNIINFEGRVVGSTTGGHFSVVGAYHAETDSVLILDTAAHKNPWFWVDLPHLYYAMNTLDGGNKRGYLVVSDDT